MSDVTQAALAYLQAHRVLTLATQGPAGLWAAAVFYASETFTFYFLSAGDTRHVTNLLRSPRAAGTIQDDDVPWQAIRGIQLEGPVQQLHGPARDHAIDVYRDKFPFLAGAPEPVQTALAKVDWFRLSPDRLYFIDNRRGFGHRDRII